MHWHAHSEIFDKSSLSLLEEFKLSLTTEKIDVSSAKSLGLQSNRLGKSLMYTKKNNGPKIDSCGTPALRETIWTTDHCGLLFGGCF